MKHVAALQLLFICLACGRQTSPSEDYTPPVCETHYGDIEASTDDQINEIASCRYIVGNIKLGREFEQAGLAQTSFTFDRLERVDGSIAIAGLPTVSELEFPLLKTVGGPVTIGLVGFGAPQLRRLELPLLESVSGGIVVNDTQLTQLALPALTNIHEAASEAHRVGLRMLRNQNLRLLDIKLLTESPYSFDFIANDSLDDTNGFFNNIKAVGGNVTIVGNDSFRSVYMYSLESVGGRFVVSNNYSLESISTPNLKIVGECFEIYDNGRGLAQCEIDQLVTSIDNTRCCQCRGNNNPNGCP